MKVKFPRSITLLSVSPANVLHFNFKSKPDHLQIPHLSRLQKNPPRNWVHQTLSHQNRCISSNCSSNYPNSHHQCFIVSLTPLHNPKIFAQLTRDTTKTVARARQYLHPSNLFRLLVAKTLAASYKTAHVYFVHGKLRLL